MEGSGRFRAVPPTALRPWPWGASHLGCTGWPRGWGRTKGRESSSRWEYQNPLWQVSGGKVWEGLEGLGVQVGLPILLGLRPRPPGHLYKVSQGEGEKHTINPQGLCATLPPLNPVAPQLDPGLDAVLDRNPLGFSPSSFLGGVHLWTAERYWIAATGCVDTNGGVVPSTLLRGACSWDLSMGLDRGTVRGIDILAVGRSLKFLAAGICTNSLHQLYFRYIGW